MFGDLYLSNFSIAIYREVQPISADFSDECAAYSNLKMGAKHCCETSVSIYHINLHHIPDDINCINVLLVFAEYTMRLKSLTKKTIT
jgi:hypothetical protein